MIYFEAPAPPPDLPRGQTIRYEYTVVCQPSGVITHATSCPIVIPNLANGVAYSFTLTARNTSGTSLPVCYPPETLARATPDILRASHILTDQSEAYKQRGNIYMYAGFMLLAAFHCVLPALLRAEVRRSVQRAGCSDDAMHEAMML